jgi:hypothetical protein
MKDLIGMTKYSLERGEIIDKLTEVKKTHDPKRYGFYPMIAFKTKDYGYKQEIYDAIDDSKDKSLVFQPYSKTIHPPSAKKKDEDAKLTFEK